MKSQVRVQRTPTDRLLGCAIWIPADIIRGFVKYGAESLDIEFEAMPSAIMLKLGDAQQ